MSNTKNLANLAAALDDGTSGQVLQSTGSGGVAFADSSGSGVTVHANQAAMLTDAASADEGTLHYETGTNKLYVKQSSGFYLLASITNASPTIDSFSENTGGAGANNLTAGGTFELTAGSNTVVTINATEPDLETISYSATVTSGTATNVFSSPSFPVTNQSSNVFTLTPATSGSGGTVTIRFDASDGTNVANVSHSFEIAFVIADSHYTTLLMATDGSAGNNQDDISDSSSSNHTITVNGDAHAGTFSPYRHGGYSTYFDGNDYLSIAHSTDLDLGTGDFTIEGWWRFDDTSNQNLVSKYAANAGFVLQYQSGNLRLVLGLGASDAVYSFSWTPVAGTWYHVCILRDGTNGKAFINGTQIGSTTTVTTSNVGTTGTLQIGLTHTVSEYTRGYVSDVRIVKGTAITPASGGPTERLTSVTNTKLLTCHLPYIADGSSSAHSITVNGDTSTKPFGPYDYSAEYSESTHGGSVYFNGTTDFLTLPQVSALGSSHFEVSFWVYPTSSTCILIDWADNNGGVRRYLAPHVSLISGSLNWFTKNASGTNITMIADTSTVPLNTWVYITIKRYNNDTKMYANGIQVGSTYSNNSFDFVVAPSRPIIGKNGYNSSNFLSGNIADLTIKLGTDVIDGSAPTVPTTPQSSSGTALHIKGTDAHVLDKSQVSNLELLGTAASTSALTSGTTPPYIGAAWANTSAVSFDGNSDYVRVPYESIPSFGAGEFTIEGWIYMNNLSASQLIVDKYASGNSQSFQIYYRSTGTSLTFYVGSSILLQDPSSSTISVQTWHHFAVTRDGSNNVRLYVDGLKKAQSTSSVNFDSSIDLHLGVQGSTSTNYFNGYMQDIRLSNKAHYTAADESSNIPFAPLKG